MKSTEKRAKKLSEELLGLVSNWTPPLALKEEFARRINAELLYAISDTIVLMTKEEDEGE